LNKRRGRRRGRNKRREEGIRERKKYAPLVRLSLREERLKKGVRHGRGGWCEFACLFVVSIHRSQRERKKRKRRKSLPPKESGEGSV
jgi:hypothetical protein